MLRKSTPSLGERNKALPLIITFNKTFTILAVYKVKIILRISQLGDLSTIIRQATTPSFCNPFKKMEERVLINYHNYHHKHHDYR